MPEPVRVALQVFEQADLLDVGGPYEVLLTANRLAQRAGRDAPFDVELVAAAPGPVTLYGGMVLQVGADAGGAGAAMAGGMDADLGAAAMAPMPANGSPALGAIIVGGGGVGSAAAASGGSGDVTGGGVESNDALEGGGGGGVRCCTGGGAEVPATAATTPDAASAM